MWASLQDFFFVGELHGSPCCMSSRPFLVVFDQGWTSYETEPEELMSQSGCGRSESDAFFVLKQLTANLHYEGSPPPHCW